MSHRFGVLLAGWLALSSAAGAQEASFTGIGFPEGTDESFANGVSADGRVVVGSARVPVGVGGNAITWTREGGIVALPNLEPSRFSPAQGSAAAVSDDGSVVVGALSRSDLITVQAGWWIDGAPAYFGVPGEPTTAGDISGDASIVVGSGFVWTEAGGVELVNLALGAVSRDGTIAAGHQAAPWGWEAIRWTPESGPVPLGPFDDGASQQLQQVTAVSADGSVIVGTINSSGPGLEAFRWTEESGIVALDAIAGAEFRGRAWDVSDDGAIVVGFAILSGAYVWDPLHGMQALQPYLEQQFGLDLSGWDLEDARGISADGRTIVGHGTNPDGAEEGWVVELPHRPGDVVRIDVRPFSGRNRIRANGPGLVPVTLFGATYFDVEDVEPADVTLGPAEAAPWFALRPFDLDHDGERDLLLFFSSRELGLAPGDEEACLRGRTIPGMPFEGCDGVEVRPGCRHGAGAAAALPLVFLLRRRRVA